MTGPVGVTAAASTADDVVRAAMSELVALDGVRRVGVALTEGGGRRLRFTATDRQAAGGVPDWCHIDAYDDVPLTTVVRTGDPIAADLDHLDDRFAALVEAQRGTGSEALAAVPLPGPGSTWLGGVLLYYDRRQSFDAAQLDDLASRAAEVAGRIRRAQVVAPRRAVALTDVPTPDDGLVAHTLVEPHPRAVGAARRFLRGQLGDWGLDDDVVDTAVLCLSELVTNAVIHTGSPTEVRAVADPDALTVTVRDQGGPARRTDADGGDDPLRVHGRGLQVVEALASRWGSELDEMGTTVWFALEPDPAA